MPRIDSTTPTVSLSNSWTALESNYSPDEAKHLNLLLSAYTLSPEQRKSITKRARDLLEKVTQLTQKGSMIDSLMKRYPLKTQEGVAGTVKLKSLG